MSEPFVQAAGGTLALKEAPAFNQEERDLLTVVKGGGISFVGTVVTRAVNYLYSFVLVWGLGAENFGLYTLALAIVTFIGVVAELGLSLSIVRFGAIDEARGQSSVHRVTMTALLISIPVGLLFSVMLQTSAGLIAGSIFHKPELAVLLKLLAWGVPLMAVQSLLTAATKARKLVQYTALVVMTQSVSAFVLAILFMVLKLGLHAVVLSYVLSFVLGTGLAVVFYLRVIPRAGHFELFPLRELVQFSLPLTFTKWIQFVNDRTEVIFLGLLPSAVFVGIYKIAWSLAGLETMLRLSMEEILAPFSSDLSYRKEIKQLDSLYKTTAKWSFTGALLLACIYLLFGVTLMKFFDPRFAIGASVLVALAFAQLCNEATGACGTILIMSGRSDLSLLNTIVLFASSIALDWSLIPRYGLSGAAFAGAFTIILVNLLRVIEVWILLRIHPFTWGFLKPIVAGLAGGILIWALRSLTLASTPWVDGLYGILFVLIYFVGIWLLKIEAEDRLILGVMRRKVGGVFASLRGTT